MILQTNLKEEYLDIYEAIHTEVISMRFDKNSGLSTTYLGRTDITGASKIKVEGRCPVSEQGYMSGILLDGNRMSDIIQELTNYLCPRHRTHKNTIYMKLGNIRCNKQWFRNSDV